MAEVKGKFITLACMLMQDVPDAQAKADELLEDETGCTHTELDPEDFYDTKLFDRVVKIYISTKPDPKEAIINLGKRIYPTQKRTVGFPDSLKTPIDFMKFEAEGFQESHTGDDIIPRKILKEADNEITMYAQAPGYDENIYIGVWLGILEMNGITTGEVENLGEHTYRIHW